MGILSMFGLGGGDPTDLRSSLQMEQDAGGGGFPWSNFLGTLALGGLQAGAQYGIANTNNQNTAAAQQLAQQKFEEDKRMNQLNYELALKKLAMSGGGGGGGGGGGAAAAALAFQKQKALSDAYILGAQNAMKMGDQASANYLAIAAQMAKPYLR